MSLSIGNPLSTELNPGNARRKNAARGDNLSPDGEYQSQLPGWTHYPAPSEGPFGG